MRRSSARGGFCGLFGTRRFYHGGNAPDRDHASDASRTVASGISPRVSAPLPQAPHKAAGALGVGAAILYVFLWASAFVPSRILAHSAPPLTILWIRFLIAGGVLFVGARLAGL